MSDDREATPETSRVSGQQARTIDLSSWTAPGVVPDWARKGRSPVVPLSSMTWHPPVQAPIETATASPRPALRQLETKTSSSPVQQVPPTWADNPLSVRAPWPPTSSSAARADGPDPAAPKRGPRGRYAKGMSGNRNGRPPKKVRELSPSANDQAWADAIFKEVQPGVIMFDLVIAQVVSQAAAGDLKAIDRVVREYNRLLERRKNGDPSSYYWLEQVKREIANSTGERKRGLERLANEIRTTLLRPGDK